MIGKCLKIMLFIEYLLFQETIFSLHHHNFVNMIITIIIIIISPTLTAQLLWMWKFHITSLNLGTKQSSKQHPDKENQQKDLLLCSYFSPGSDF